MRRALTMTLTCMAALALGGAAHADGLGLDHLVRRLQPYRLAPHHTDLSIDLKPMLTADEIVASFIGSPPMNLIDAAVEERAGKPHAVLPELSMPMWWRRQRR